MGIFYSYHSFWNTVPLYGSKKTSGRGGCSAICLHPGAAVWVHSARPCAGCRTRPHGNQAGGCEVSIDLLVVTNHLLQVGCFHCGHFLYRHYWAQREPTGALPLENSLLVWIPATLDVIATQGQDKWCPTRGWRVREASEQTSREFSKQCSGMA